ncbi:hypothetical protein LZC95_47680 [Pendulispora brunnea]|uniref:Uncharacterized protein n=1 Tax=Pendulispora brunnea TaxID=2905690 RepID=A0ABZ2K5Y1_9BACT
MRPGTLLPILVVMFAVASAFLACESSEPARPPDPSTHESIVTFGHGVFVGANGKSISPDLALLRRTQEEFIDMLRREAAAMGHPSSHATETRIAGEVADEVLARARFIDWLNEDVRPVDRIRIGTVNEALRAYYIEHFAPGDVAANEARKMNLLTATNSGGEKYIRECMAAGVPIPPPMFSSAWTNRGLIDDDFLGTGGAEVMHYESTQPAGTCLALPRYMADNKTISLLGIICLGTVSNKACFWDSPRSGPKFTRGEVIDINRFVGGFDLKANNQGECTDCHGGENPFVVHPEKTPFVGFSAFGTSWYDPLVHTDWLQNSAPTNLLDAISSPGRCDSCHRAGGSGRFPALSTRMSGYCSRVFENAVRSRPSPGTMPPYDMDQSQFKAHIDALRAQCKAPPSTGTVVPVDTKDDPSHVSPPIVIDPLYACATQVAVRGAILDAKVTLSINGVDVGSLIARNPAQEVFNVPALSVGDEVVARQESLGVVSGPSATVKVRDHKVDYPAGLPAPVIDPALIYECAEIISVRHVPGAQLTVTVNGGSAVTGGTSTDWTAIWPGKRPFTVGDAFEAKIQLCSDVSPLSAVEKAVAAPSSLSAPTFDPPMTFTGQELVNLSSLTNGTHTKIDVAGVGSAGGFTTPISWFPNYDIKTPLGRSLISGDVLVAQQTLCKPGPTTKTPPASRCEELPAPRIHQPIAGTNFVVVWQSIPGARIRVYDAGGNELGDGSGTIIVLSRNLTDSDVLTVVQQVGDCRSKTGYRISVRGKN